MGDLFEDYTAGPAWDEMFDQVRGIRPGYAALHSALAALGVDDLAERGALRDRSLRDYADVPPLKGVHSTGTPESLEVEVRITRLA